MARAPLQTVGSSAQLDDSESRFDRVGRLLSGMLLQLRCQAVLCLRKLVTGLLPHMNRPGIGGGCLV
jgi:hypothetical protein